MFPLHNLSGKVIAFGGRILAKEKKADTAKYINTPETEIFHKSNAVYGIFLAKKSIRQLDNCYLVEGYMDVVSMHQAGVENTVAASGTSLTQDQIRLIKRFTSNITMLFDGDRAGIKAALRSIDMVLEEGMNVRLVLLPDGHDPDSYSHLVSQTEFQKYLRDNARDFIAFKTDLYAAEAGNDPMRRAESIREVVSSIAHIPDAIKRMVYIQESAARLRMPEEVLVAELNKVILRERKKGAREEMPEPEVVIPQVPTEQPEQQIDSLKIQERETIRLLLNYAESDLGEARLAEFLFAELDDISFSDPVFAQIFGEMRSRWESGLPTDSSHFLSNGSEEVRNLVAELVTPRYGTSEHWQEKYHIFFPKENELVSQLASSHVLRIKFRFLQSLITANLGKIKESEKSGDWEAMEGHLTRHQEFKEAERKLAESLGIVVAR